MSAYVAQSLPSQQCVDLTSVPVKELLKAQDSTAAGQQGAQQTADTSQPSTDDLVPISAWLGQQSEPMDRRIAEEALLAGVDYSSEEAQSSFGASSGAGLAPGAAEGLTSAPVQSQPVSADSGSSQPRDLQPARGSQQQESVRSGESFRSSSSQESRPGAAGSAPQGQDAYSNPGFEIAVASGLEPSDGGLQDRESRDPASEQETYREDAGGAESGRLHISHLLMYPMQRHQTNLSSYKIGSDGISCLGSHGSSFTWKMHAWTTTSILTVLLKVQAPGKAMCQQRKSWRGS